MNKKIVLAGLIIIILLVTGCATTAKAKSTNTNFQVVWSEVYDDPATRYYTSFAKIDVINDNRECYIVRHGEAVAMSCFEKV
jgi:outer membrane biogenesis lipoprotein LolB